MAKKSTSTLLDGNHAFPKFYACYLLRSLKVPNSQKTYVGSTPDPPRRLRQHNGELTQGAWKTSNGRPWEAQMIVYGFPSKLTALQVCAGGSELSTYPQFEWAWQHPYKSRHLRDEDGQIFKRDNAAGRIVRRVLTAVALLRSHPFRHLPLHVRCFTTETYELFNRLVSKDATVTVVEESTARNTKAKSTKSKAGSVEARVMALPPLPAGVTVTLDLRGMPRAFAKKEKKRRNAAARCKEGKNKAAADEEMDDDPSEPSSGTATPVDTQSAVHLLHLDDMPLRTAAWETWTHLARTNGLSCALCASPIIEDHLTFALCTCGCATHLPCLARTSLQGDSLMPIDVGCSRCNARVPWGEVIRGCYARRDAAAVQAGVREDLEDEEEDGDGEEDDGEEELDDLDDDNDHH